MAAKQLMLPANRAFNSNGLAVSGAQAKLYASGGTTPANFYSDSGLSTSLGSALTANGAGRFPTAYQDSTVAFRLKILDSDGAVLDDIDPYFFGLATGVDGANASIAVGTTTTGPAGGSASVSNSGTGTNAILNFTVPVGATGPAGDVAKADTRSSLAAIIGQATGATRFLREPGREGMFVWSSSNLSTQVAADTQQGLYVAPASDTTGASGAWVRKYHGPASLLWFGAVADCTAAGSGTSNTTIFDAARAAIIAANKGWLHIPQQPAAYRFATAPAEIHDKIIITGEGWSFNPGTVGVTTYVGIQGYNGTVLCFDADVPGFLFVDFTDNAANSTSFEYQSSRGSCVRDLMLYSAGGVGTTSHGIERRTVVHLDNVRIEGFAGCGLKTLAWTSGSSSYGLADGALARLVVCISNKLHGFDTEGNDSNVLHYDTCKAQTNGGVGFLDKGQLGNKYTNPQAATNNQSHPSSNPGAFSAAQRTQVTADWAGLSDQLAGSYVTTSLVAAHTFTGAYSESGQGTKHEIIKPSIIVGGYLSSTSTGTSNANATVLGANNILNGEGGTSVTSLTGNANFALNPIAGTFSIFNMYGTNGSAALGLNILAGNNLAQFSSDTFYYKNAAQTVTYGTLGSGGLTLSGNAGNTTLAVTGTGTYSLLQLFPASSSGNGLQIMSGNGFAEYSTGTHYFENAAKSVVYATIDGTGLNLGSGAALKFNGTTAINSSGVLQAAGVPAFSGGDVTSAGGSLALSIGANAVTYSKFQQVAASSLVGNPTGSLANAQGITLAADHSFSGTTLQLGAFSGDITKAAGSLATTIGTNVVTYAKFQQVAANSLVGNPTGSLANAQGITLAGGLAFSGTTLTAAGALTPTSVASTGSVTTSSATASFGFATGSGGAVTQVTSRTTGVTLSKPTGAITLFSTTTTAGQVTTFTVTNTQVAATDTINLSVKSGMTGVYFVFCTAVAAGSFSVSVYTPAAVGSAEAPVINFAVVKAVAA